MAETDANVPWPNQKEVVDGVVPVSEVSQDPGLFSTADNTDDILTEMKG